MENIKITEENKEMYKKFCNLKNGILVEGKQVLTVMGMTMFFVTSAAITLGLLGAIMSNLVIPTIVEMLVIGASAISFCYGASKTWELTEKTLLKQFQKEYPDFDTNVNVSELKKALEKYELLSSIPKDIEKQQEEHLAILPEGVKELTSKEKVDFLEQEKKFWQQVNDTERILNNIEEQEETKPYQKTKTESHNIF